MTAIHDRQNPSIKLLVDSDGSLHAVLVDSSGSEISVSNPLPVQPIDGPLTHDDLEGLGDVTVGTSEVELTITGTPTETIRIRADNANTGTVYIGKTGVLSDGTNDFVRLSAGDEVVVDYDDATNALYVISDVVAQTISVGALL